MGCEPTNRAQNREDLLDQRSHGANRRGQHDQFGIGDDLGEVSRRFIRRAELVRPVSRVGPTRPHRDASGDLALSGRKTDGAAQQAGAEDGKFAKRHRIPL
jgi:hypothetical protein